MKNQERGNQQPVKIDSFELENVKRIKAVALEPTKDGLTVIGGRNGQGKTSILDAISWALGGGNKKPSNAMREGSMVPPELHVTLSNGIIVERKGKNSTLKVTDSTGKKAGQALLNEFISGLALDLPKFMEANDKEKALTLLQTLGIDDQLEAIDDRLQRMADERLIAGREARAKEAHAEELHQWDGVPSEELSVDDLVDRQQQAMDTNAANQRRRDALANLGEQLEQKRAGARQLRDEIGAMEKRLAEARGELEKRTGEVAELSTTWMAEKASVDRLEDVPTDDIREQLQEVEEINARVRDNQAKAKAIREAELAREVYEEMNADIEQVRKDRLALLQNADLPLPDLGITEESELTYKGQTWDCMSGSEQLKVATAIVRATKPECGFVLVDKLEQMDPETLTEFGQWAQGEGLQIIGTRVATDDSCTVIIEDGYVKGHEHDLEEAQAKPKAKPRKKAESKAEAPVEEPRPTWGGSEF